MQKLFVIALASVVLAGCMVKNYDKSAPTPERGKTTIHWSDGEKTDIKPMTIETRK